MLLILALLLAIPSYGLTLVLYVAWATLKKRQQKINPNKLNVLQKAVYYVAEKAKGEAISFDDINFYLLEKHFVENDINPRKIYGFNSRYHYDFEITIGARKYDVQISPGERPNENDAIFRARPSEPWLDELFSWMQHAFENGRIEKYWLRSQAGISFGAAHAPEYAPEKPVHVPELLGRLTDCQSLRLINQHIVSLPRSIGKMVKLKELKLGGNALERLPNEICNLSNLELFTIWMNELKELPSEFGKLSNLRRLDLSDNQLTRLPDSIINLGNIERFYMTGNKDLKLTTLQKNWIVGLLERDAVVLIDKDRYDQIKAEYPYAPPMKWVDDD